MTRRARRIEAAGHKDMARAWTEYYSRLARHFMGRIGQRRLRVVLEAGCGEGQLTIPLLRILPRGAQMIAIDSSRGPYTGWLDELATRVREDGLEKRIRLIKADARRIRGVGNESVDLLVSNELLCDLPYDSQLEKALEEFHRVLRPGGLMVHGEWASSPASGRQAFLVNHWPSWTPDQLFSMMSKHGFHEFQVSYFDTTIHFGYENAIEELREWGAENSFLRRYDRLLRREGLDLPFEHVVQCQK